MRRGRKPKPGAIRKLQGKAGHRPIPDEPIPEGDLDTSSAPAWLTEDQKLSFAFALKHAPRGVLKAIDRGALAKWAVLDVRMRDATIQQNKIGQLLVRASKKSKNYVQSPFLAIQNRAIELGLKLESELGFTPASRPRLALKPTRPLPDDDPDAPSPAPAQPLSKAEAEAEGQSELAQYIAANPSRRLN